MTISEERERENSLWIVYKWCSWTECSYEFAEKNILKKQAEGSLIIRFLLFSLYLCWENAQITEFQPKDLLYYSWHGFALRFKAMQHNVVRHERANLY